MSYVPLEKMIDKTDFNMYRLVVLAAKRAVALEEGAANLINADSHLKKTTVALLEIAEGKIKVKE